MRSPSLTPHLSAIVACFDFWREICHPAFSDFCNTIGTPATSQRDPVRSGYGGKPEENAQAEFFSV